MPTAPVSSVPRTRAAPAAGLVLALVLGPAVAGCAYEYDDGSASGTASASVPAVTDAALPPDPRANQPVTGAELDEWAAEVLPEAEGLVVRSRYGILGAGEHRKETISDLPGGGYALTLACRSPRRVSFSFGHDNAELVDLNLRCGTSRVNVVYLPAGVELHITVEANAAANFAYRLRRF